MLFGSLAVGLILFYFINKYQEKVKKNIQSDPNLSDNGRFLLDNPIDNDKDDRYGYTILADQIVSAVLDPRQTSHSFTIGINGQWGIGKSSLLRLIKNRLDQKLLKSESDHILITFSPLLLNTANTLTIEFLHQLNAQLRKYSIQSNDQLRKYIYFLTNKINDLWSGLISIFSGDQSSQDQSKILAGIIMSINRQIIVTIDDLDRLEKEEIIEIFRLIRNIADLPYLTYIIAFDKEYLCKKLEEKEDIRKAESFIEKFFAVEVVLPKIKNELVREHFVEESRKRIPYFSQGIDQAFNIFENQDRMLGFVRDKIVPLNFFMASLNTRRDIIRFINSLILFPQELLIEVIPGEIIILELLKLKNAKVYNDLKKKAIVTLNYSKHVYFLEEQKLDDLLKDNYPVNSAYIKSAVKILFGTEFPTETNLDRKSIVNEDRYEIYFNYIDTSFLHYSELDALRKK
jgi:predicted KAP-like P-loop ATPase